MVRKHGFAEEISKPISSRDNERHRDNKAATAEAIYADSTTASHPISLSAHRGGLGPLPPFETMGEEFAASALRVALAQLSSMLGYVLCGASGVCAVRR